jgi:hypothetical protein
MIVTITRYGVSVYTRILLVVVLVYTSTSIYQNHGKMTILIQVAGFQMRDYQATCSGH